MADGGELTKQSLATGYMYLEMEISCYDSFFSFLISQQGEIHGHGYSDPL
jgi:hypothetical protein